ncbi:MULTISPECIES: hypothetical protein [unclassified Lysobacter]|uniref:hypothetical protein n=1 Tax=unclassified Lysobacter TaxID=2635362 RepID=UPI0006F60D88|nr:MULTISPECIES: hypothetical protein [unclassified Lysobacter]KQZ55525.1 hypothetical protein ASD53_14670 [Lysobacter sp. Root559]KRA70764.1 hypothetical protein ASD78_18245 [Lysobacter sp. Root667]KRC31459.1 hypothetical protein ASE10_17115 [Lysobacter sp. Root76]KRD65365.1 hypothetical protein ASE45_18320 [Lysobacter sp. Root96]
MSAVRQGLPGSTRTCPHCKTTILDSASVCPACKHHLKFDPDALQQAAAKFSPLHVEGTIHAPAEGAWEYTMLLAIRDEDGNEITRQVVGVGALFPGEQRTFTLAVEAVAATGYKAVKRKR